MNSCPCHSQKPYDTCCKPLHTKTRPAQNALELMRSRYSAYALQLVGYLIETTHPTNPIFEKELRLIEEEKLYFARITTFYGLDIVEFIDGQKVAYVTFIAYLRQGKKDISFQEKSSFEKVDGKWLYKSGIPEPIRKP